MKKILFPFIFVILITNIYAQIDLEHTYDYNSGVVPFVSSSNEMMYCLVTDTISNQVQIFNQDYSLYCTTTIDRPEGYAMRVYYPSDKLFNTNEEFEFIILFSNSYYSTKVVIYDENATIIKDFGEYDGQIGSSVWSNGNTCKLIIQSYEQPYEQYPSYKHEVYSLPGCIENKLNIINSTSINPAFPNPSNTFIYLPYELKNGEQATITIYNSYGQIIEQKSIDSKSDRIKLDVQHYKKGIYTYSYNNFANKFIVN